MALYSGHLYLRALEAPYKKSKYAIRFSSKNDLEWYKVDLALLIENQFPNPKHFPIKSFSPVGYPGPHLCYPSTQSGYPGAKGNPAVLVGSHLGYPTTLSVKGVLNGHTCQSRKYWILDFSAEWSRGELSLYTKWLRLVGLARDLSNMWSLLTRCWISAPEQPRTDKDTDKSLYD